MDYAALRTLIETHPTHGSETDQALADWCNDASAVTRDRATVPSTEIFTECLRENAEWAALAADDRQEVRDILTVWDDIPTASGEPARTRLIAILGTNTKAAIAALIPEQVSRATEADLPVITSGKVAVARTYVEG